MVNGRKVYSVRFYSLSIIQRRKTQRGGGEEGQERVEETGRRGGDKERRRVRSGRGGKRLHFGVHLLNVAETRSVAAMFCSLKASPDV